MAKAWRCYLADVVGDGTRANPYRPACANQGFEWSGRVQTDANGVPTEARCLVAVESQNPGQVVSLGGITYLPQIDDYVAEIDHPGSPQALQARAVALAHLQTLPEVANTTGQELFELLRVRRANGNPG